MRSEHIRYCQFYSFNPCKSFGIVLSFIQINMLSSLVLYYVYHSPWILLLIRNHPNYLLWAIFNRTEGKSAHVRIRTRSFFAKAANALSYRVQIWLTQFTQLIFLIRHCTSLMHLISHVHPNLPAYCTRVQQSYVIVICTWDTWCAEWNSGMTPCALV